MGTFVSMLLDVMLQFVKLQSWSGGRRIEIAGKTVLGQLYERPVQMVWRRDLMTESYRTLSGTLESISISCPLDDWTLPPPIPHLKFPGKMFLIRIKRFMDASVVLPPVLPDPGHMYIFSFPGLLKSILDITCTVGVIRILRA